MKQPGKAPNDSRQALRANGRVETGMLVVRVELWPHGDESRTKEIGRLLIYNVGGDNDHGDYRVALAHRGRTDTRKIMASPARSGEVNQHGRLRAHVWTLVAKALDSVGFTGEDHEGDDLEKGDL
jgi:hypothetical protein